MIKEVMRYFRLFFGFFICALGIIFTIKSNLGFSPWNVLHQGISLVSPLTIGQASIAVGFIIITLDFFMGEKIGSGSILNMIFIGLFMDLILFLNFIPLVNTLLNGILMMFIGISLIGIGCYFYISTGLGCGPRDALMVALLKKTNLPISVIRNILEISVLLIGYLLGGFAGLGTIIIAIFMGPMIQNIFKALKFDVKAVKHRDIKKEIVLIKRYVSNR